MQAAAYPEVSASSPNVVLGRIELLQWPSMISNTELGKFWFYKKVLHVEVFQTAHGEAERGTGMKAQSGLGLHPRLPQSRRQIVLQPRIPRAI